jgi:hypothetical protein
MSFTESIKTSDNKRQFLATTIQQMANEFKDDETTQKTFNNMLDSLGHTAPEILDSTWRDLFNLGMKCFSDASNPTHEKVKNIYNSRYMEYVKLYKK